MICEKCDAKHFVEDRSEGIVGGEYSSVGRPLFTGCCGNACFTLPLRPEPEPELRELLEHQTDREFLHRDDL